MLQRNSLPESDEALAQVTQGHCGCSIPGSAQGQVGWSLGQSDLVWGNQPTVEGLKFNDLKSPFRLHPDSINLFFFFFHCLYIYVIYTFFSKNSEVGKNTSKSCASWI